MRRGSLPGPALPSSFDKHPVLGRGDEGGIIAGRRAGRPEPALVRLTPDSVSEALHGGGVVVHVSSPLSV